jgi:hypothetical protein
MQISLSVSLYASTHIYRLTLPGTALQSLQFQLFASSSPRYKPPITGGYTSLGRVSGKRNARLRIPTKALEKVMLKTCFGSCHCGSIRFEASIEFWVMDSALPTELRSGSNPKRIPSRTQRQSGLAKNGALTCQRNLTPAYTNNMQYLKANVLLLLQVR